MQRLLGWTQYLASHGASALASQAELLTRHECLNQRCVDALRHWGRAIRTDQPPPQEKRPALAHWQPSAVSARGPRDEPSSPVRLSGGGLRGSDPSSEKRPPGAADGIETVREQPIDRASALRLCIEHAMRTKTLEALLDHLRRWQDGPPTKQSLASLLDIAGQAPYGDAPRAALIERLIAWLPAGDPVDAALHTACVTAILGLPAVRRERRPAVPGRLCHRREGKWRSCSPCHPTRHRRACAACPARHHRRGGARPRCPPQGARRPPPQHAKNALDDPTRCQPADAPTVVPPANSAPVPDANPAVLDTPPTATPPHTGGSCAGAERRPAAQLRTTSALPAGLARPRPSVYPCQPWPLAARHPHVPARADASSRSSSAIPRSTQPSRQLLETDSPPRRRRPTRTCRTRTDAGQRHRPRRCGPPWRQ